MLANKTTGSTYSGPIHVDTGPSFNNFVGSGTAVPVGNGILTFSDANNATFYYDLDAGTGAARRLFRRPRRLPPYDLGTGPQPTCT